MLLERADLLDALQAALGRVRETAAGEIVIVSGEAGIGKTSLLREFARTAAVPVWWGSCDPLHSPRPLGPVLDIVRTAGHAMRTVASLDRAGVFDTVLLALAERDGPVVVVIEDAHWADEATLDLVTHLGRRIGETRALLVLSHRDDDDAHARLRATLGVLAVPLAGRVRPASLSAAAVRAMVGTRPVDADRLLRITDGNPFFVTECLAAVPAAASRDAPLTDVPESVADAVAARVARLGPAGLQCLTACSIHPGPAAHGLVEALSGADASGLDECVAHGLLVDSASGVVFRHELARLAVLATVRPVRRRELHRLALRHFLAHHPSEPTWPAFHAEQAGDGEHVLHYAPAAATRAAAVGANRVAVAHLAAAVAYADRLPTDRRADLLHRYAAACAATGALADAVAGYESAIALRQQRGDVVREAAARTDLAATLMQRGRQPESEAQLRTAVDLLAPRGPSPELGAAYVRTCAAHMLARELDEAVVWGDRAMAVVTELGLDDQRAHLLVQSGIARLMAGDEGGLDSLREGVALARELGLHAVVLLGHLQLGSGAGEIHRYDLAEPALREALTWGAEHELAIEYPQAWLARCRLDLGAWAEAEELATPVAEHSDSGIARFVALGVLGRLLARRGEPGAWDALDEALDLARQTGHLQRMWPVATARAEAAWIEGRLEDAVPLLEEALVQAVALDYATATDELNAWLVRAGRRPAPAPVWWVPEQSFEVALAAAESGEPRQVQAAFGTLDRLGADAVVPLVARRLRRLGASVPPRASAATRARADGLTRRQAEIAALLERGLSNKQIAGEFYLSERTVEHHVAAVLAKLGVDSRRELLHRAQARRV